jgi:hypothetical protein
MNTEWIIKLIALDLVQYGGAAQPRKIVSIEAAFGISWRSSRLY